MTARRKRCVLFSTRSAVGLSERDQSIGISKDGEQEGARRRRPVRQSVMDDDRVDEERTRQRRQAVHIGRNTYPPPVTADVRRTAVSDASRTYQTRDWTALSALSTSESEHAANVQRSALAFASRRKSVCLSRCEASRRYGECEHASEADRASASFLTSLSAGARGEAGSSVLAARR